ncbi:exosome complex component rrp4 like protein [Quercus suber]|uniref:Exosome complex component rrp4 like protein n=1 Tax=Quercus suber TaxID=58331 RepID=A0AAW0JEE4_QUESU
MKNGTLYLASASHEKYPGKPQEFKIYSNSTFHIPVNDAHQAEVCGIQQDGLHLQARSQKYGKLERGQLLTVPPYLVRRRKQNFHHLEQCGVDLILGCNGFIWVGEHVEAKDDMVEDQASKLEQQNIKSNKNSISLEKQEQTHNLIETRQSICRIANAVRISAGTIRSFVDGPNTIILVTIK